MRRIRSRPIPRAAAFAILLLLAFHHSRAAAPALVTRELFENIGTLTGTNPGNLGAVSGTFVKRPVGPRRLGGASPGWSAETRASDLYHTFDLQSSPGSAAQASGMFGAWYYLSSAFTDGVNKMRLIQLRNLAGGGNNPIADAYVDANLNLSLSFYNGGDQPNVATLQPNSWYWIALEWRQHDASVVTYDAAFYIKPAGRPLIPLGAPVSGIQMFADFQDIQGGAVSTGGFAVLLARYGAPSLYQLPAYPYAAYPPGLVEPVVARHTWYVNPATGNDNNTGLSESQAWQSVSKINDEAQNVGILASSRGFQHGDTLVFDTLRAPLALGSNSLFIPTDGITLQPAPHQRYALIQAEETIAPSSWSRTNGYTFIYQTADTGTDSVLWENDKWLNHPTGNSFSDVATSLDTTPGSFWTDGTTMYLHAFNGGNPSTSGSTYTRSQYRGSGDSAVEMAGNSWSVTGLRVRKTCLADPATNDPVGAYCFQQVGNVTSGTCRITNSYFDYGSKHLMGFTADSVNTTLLAENITCEQASPYAGFGGQSPFVSFVSTGTGNTHIYKNCTSLHNAGLIGSATGQATAIYPAFITHGQGDAFKSLQFLDCHFACGPFNDQGTVIDGGLVIKNSSLLTAEFGSPGVSISGCTIQNGLAFSFGGAISASRITSTLNYTGIGAETLSGTCSIRDCLIDLRQNPTPRGGNFSPWYANSPLTLTFEHNTFLVPPMSDLTLINGLSSSNTLKFSSNIYQLGTGEWFIGSYNSQPLTFSQWEALGFDLNSKATLSK
jgi:hypothetical protein